MAIHANTMTRKSIGTRELDGIICDLCCITNFECSVIYNYMRSDNSEKEMNYDLIRYFIASLTNNFL